MDYIIPPKLTPLAAINFSKCLDSGRFYNEFVYDFKNMQHCHPYGLLVIASAIRNNMKKYPDATHKLKDTVVTQGGEFAANFGLYQSIGFDVGTAKEENDSGYRYIPIKKISAKDLHAQYTDTTLLNEKVNRHAAALSDILVGDQPKNIREAMQYCFREIIRNTFEHARISELWVCGQYWPTRHEAEIAVLDEGIGIFQSLRSNPRISVSTCTEANMLALQPGLSRTLGMKQNPYDVWQNSGYGLYVASTLCGINGGYFVISSGDSALLINGKQESKYAGRQTGTAICLNIRTDSGKLRNFDATLSAIVAEGEKKAQENGEKRILTASKVTTIASMIRHIESSAQSSDKSAVTYLGLIPINTIVSFSVNSIDRRNRLVGTFIYNGQSFDGVLLNVTSFNRNLYLKGTTDVPCVVRKYKDGTYYLLERHRYEQGKTQH